MDGKSKAKWFFIGLAAGWAPIVIAAIALLVWINRPGRNDPFHGVRPDMGVRLHEFGRSAEWNATHMPLGNSGFKAAAGPNRYTDKPDQDWDHYSIDVERPEGKSSYVYFQRDFRMDEIPRDLVDKKVQDIVTFDEQSRVVTFDLGTRIETYTLPNREQDNSHYCCVAAPKGDCCRKEGKQMTMPTAIGAPSGDTIDWTAIDWPKITRDVRRLQMRIAKSTRTSDPCVGR